MFRKPLGFSVLVSALGLFLAASAWAGDGKGDSGDSASGWSTNADQLDETWNHAAGDITTRFGLDFTAAAGFGGEGGVSLPDEAIIGLDAGAGYFPIAQLSADLDLGGSIVLAEEGIDFTNISITPGAHYYPVNQLFLRAGVPIVISEPSSFNLLGGFGYEIPVNDTQNLVGEIDLIYPLDGEGSGTITAGGGYSLTF